MPKPSAVVFAKDVPRVVAFYAELVPMQAIRRDDHHVVLDAPPMQLVIHAIPPAIAAAITITSPPEVREDVPLKLCIPVASLAGVRARAAALGGHLAPDSEAWSGPGFRACDGYDPEGNVVQFREAAP